MRINKYIAFKTKNSRRKADEMIKEGRVKVNGEVLYDFSYDASDNDEIILDGVPISQIKVKKYYYLFNKPKNVISSVKDDKGRIVVTDFFPPEINVFPVGRLDYDTTGLLLMTNDGDLANKVIHPRNHIKKVYIAKLNGRLNENQLNEFRKGIKLKTGLTMESEIDLYDFSNALYRIAIYEGKNRQIRNMIEYLNRKVVELKRISIGKIKLGDLPIGKYRKLTEKEKEYLRNL